MAARSHVLLLTAAFTATPGRGVLGKVPTPQPTPTPSLYFSAGFSDDMVLARAPSVAAVYGHCAVAGPVTVRVAGADADGAAVEYSVVAPVGHDGSWKALLHPASAGGSFQISATAAGSHSAPVLRRVTFGDIWFCSGQSNMALATQFTFSAETVLAAVASGGYSNLRLFQYGGMQFESAIASNTPQYVTLEGSTTQDPLNRWNNLSVAAATVRTPSKPPARNVTAFDSFSATCLYFGVELTDALGEDAPPIGLIQSAVGGSTIEAWMGNHTRAACTDEWVEFGKPWKPQPPLDQHVPGMLYYGYVTPFVNLTITGFLWYQGENNCGMKNVGNSATGAGYGCELPAMVHDWRQVWSATPGTTSPLAPFGIATLAAGGSEGAGNHMAAMRWAQTGNYGYWNNPALPNTFGAQLYDIADPWGKSGTGDGNRLNDYNNATRCCKTWEQCNPIRCTAEQNATNAKCMAAGQQDACTDARYCANPDPATGKYGPTCAQWNASLWWGTLASLEGVVRKNAPSGIPALNFMGGIHPRLKRAAGRRLAAAAVALMPSYRTNASTGQATTGPTLSGCTLTSATRLSLHFNSSLLGTEALTLRPFDADMSHWTYRMDSSHSRINKTDSLGLMVCTADPANPDGGNATTCACQTWNLLSFQDGGSIRYCGVGPGWKPPPELIQQGSIGEDQKNPFATQWVAVPLVEEPAKADVGSTTSPMGTVSISADLTSLGGRAPLAVRLAWPLFKSMVGSADDMCCTSAATGPDYSSMPGGGPVGAIAPCVPGNCPLYSSKSEHPANPFFAVIDGGKCRCTAPQQCDA